MEQVTLVFTVILNVDYESLTGATRVYEAAGFHVTDLHLQYEVPLSYIMDDGRWE